MRRSILIIFRFWEITLTLKSRVDFRDEGQRYWLGDINPAKKWWKPKLGQRECFAAMEAYKITQGDSK